MKSEAAPLRRRRVHPAIEPQPEAEIGQELAAPSLEEQVGVGREFAAPSPEKQVGVGQELAAPSPEKQVGVGQEVAAPSPEKQKASLHILLNAELLENVRELADYAVELGLIQNDPRGNVTDFINWCIETGKERLRQYALKRRAFI